MSYAAAGLAPTRSASTAAMDGVCCTLETVATMTASISFGSTPDFAIASLDASVARSTARTSRLARVRVMMPVRWRIHSSEELIGPTRSSLGTTRSPRAAPMERMRVYCGPCDCWRVGRVIGGAPWGLRGLVDEVEGGRQVVRRLDGNGRHALERALGEADERAGGGDLDEAGDAGLLERLHVEVPAHRRGDLTDEQPQELGAVGDLGAVLVGPEPQRRVGRGQRRGELLECRDSRRHVARVERSGDLQRDDARAGRRVLGQLGQRLHGSGDHDLTATVVVGGGEAQLVEAG